MTKKSRLTLLFFDKFIFVFIQKCMEKIYDDELLPESYDQIARAYSKSLEKKGFIFIRLDQEEFNLLLDEVFVLIAKMKACLEHLKYYIESKELKARLIDSEIALTEKFERRSHCKHKFKSIENKNMTFLTLISLENMLILKLMLLSIKSGEIELCNKIITNIASIFAQSFSLEGFKVE